jgi:hypothetical protein
MGRRTIVGTRRRRSKRGGNSGPSAWSFVLGQTGTPDVQARNALTIQPGDSVASRHSNAIEPVYDRNFQFKQSGGRRKRRSKSGGSWSATLNQALVPFSLWGMQHLTKSRRKVFKSKSKSSRRRRRSFKR